MKHTIVLILGLTLFTLFSCTVPVEKGGLLPYTDVMSIWENLYKKKDLDGKRIALSGYISLEHLRQQGEENHCELVDEKGYHLLYLTIKRNNRNSLKINVLSEEEQNNIHYIHIDEANSFILDHEGNKLPITEKILVSFDLIYNKFADTGEYPLIEVLKDGEHSVTIAKKGEKYYVFRAENIRIDKM